ncbi:Hypothetical protein HVR_LOCUS761 [uncultured virus]|nr:Hypothetical protein HVR_LOCUS761 [uncultured virus]
METIQSEIAQTQAENTTTQTAPAEVVTEYPNDRNDFPGLKLIDRTGKGFLVVDRPDFMARHAGDGRLRTAYHLKLGDKFLHKYGTPLGLCNSVEITLESGTSKKGEKGYLLTEKDDEDTNTYFVNEDTLQVTTIYGEVVHFMYDQQRSFANQRVAQNEAGEVKTVELNQTRPVLGVGCCCNNGAVLAAASAAVADEQ